MDKNEKEIYKAGKTAKAGDQEWSDKNKLVSFPTVRLYKSKNDFKEFSIKKGNKFSDPETLDAIEAFIHQNGVKF